MTQPPTPPAKPWKYRRPNRWWLLLWLVIIYAVLIACVKSAEYIHGRPTTLGGALWFLMIAEGIGGLI
jgi:hypothetical protein